MKIITSIFILFTITLNAYTLDDGLAEMFRGNYDKAKLIYSEICENGNPKGCQSLGALYVSGEPSTREYKKAIKAFEKSCDGGIEIGCTHLEYWQEFLNK